MKFTFVPLCAAALLVVASAAASAQTASDAVHEAATPARSAAPEASAASEGVALPEGYVIGPDDVLSVLFWRDKDMSGDVSVRPDGRITLPLINEVQAAGLTPEALREVLTKKAAKYLEDPNVTVVVKAINSRKIYITGQVGKAGVYQLAGPTTVLQALAQAGGVQEFADSKHILIMRTEKGRQVAYRFNYKDVLKGKNLKQNIELKPGDTVIVP